MLVFWQQVLEIVSFAAGFVGGYNTGCKLKNTGKLLSTPLPLLIGGSLGFGVFAGLVVAFTSETEGNRPSWSKVIREMLSSGFSAVIVGLIADNYLESRTMIFALVGLAGYGGKGFLNWMVTAFKAKINTEAGIPVNTGVSKDEMEGKTVTISVAAPVNPASPRVNPTAATPVSPTYSGIAPTEVKSPTVVDPPTRVIRFNPQEDPKEIDNSNAP